MIHVKVVNGHFVRVLPPVSPTPSDLIGLEWRQHVRGFAIRSEKAVSIQDFHYHGFAAMADDYASTKESKA